MKSGYELKNVPNKGEGIFATRAFDIGETIMIGCIMERLTCNDSHASQIGENIFVRHDGNIPKINHSCDPNCGIRVNKTGAHDVIAYKSIYSRNELTLDYAMRNYHIEYFPGLCLCGMPNCRGKITGWKDLPKNRKNKYSGFIPPYLLKLDRKYAQKAKNKRLNLDEEGASHMEISG